MSTIQQLTDQVNASIRNQTAANSITTTIDADQRQAVINELKSRGIVFITGTDRLENTSHLDSNGVVTIDGSALFTPFESDDEPDDIETFASANEGWLWKRSKYPLILTTSGKIEDAGSEMLLTHSDNLFLVVDSSVVELYDSGINLEINGARAVRIRDKSMGVNMEPEVAVDSAGAHRICPGDPSVQFPTTGVGMEMRYSLSSNAGEIYVYDRTNGGYRPLRLGFQSKQAVLAEDGKVGIMTETPQAALDIVSSDSGLLVPRLTTTQRNAIVSPATGLEIFNTTNGVHEYKHATLGWLPVGRNYKSWSGLLTYNAPGGTPSNPTVTVLENYIGSVVWTRVDIGRYAATLAGAFPTGKVTVITPGFCSPALLGIEEDNNIRIKAGPISADTIALQLWNQESADWNDDGIYQHPVEIRVYA